MVNSGHAVESKQALPTSEPGSAPGEVMAERDERGEESFEATIMRLDSLAPERLFRQVGER